MKHREPGPHAQSGRALSLALTLAITLNLVACGRSAGPVLPVAPAASAAAAWPASDPSRPDAASVFAALDDAERAKALQDAAAALNTSGPQNTMTKEQESKAMPLRGQANDHSAVVRDDKVKTPPPGK